MPLCGGGGVCRVGDVLKVEVELVVCVVVEVMVQDCAGNDEREVAVGARWRGWT